MCNRSAKRGCSQVVAIIGFRFTRTYRKANDTITRMDLDENKIGDEGAMAFAESLKATLVTCVLQVRATLFSWQVWARTRMSRNSGSMLFQKAFSC